MGLYFDHIFRFPAGFTGFPGRKPLPEPLLITRRNTVPQVGAQRMLRMIARADVTDITAGGNWYVGLCDQVPVINDELSDVTSELTSAGGYARKAITRNAAGWPTEEYLNTVATILSTTVTFSASGADFSGVFTRAFLCNVASGSAGILFSYGGPLTVGILVPDGQDFDMQFRLGLA